MFISAQPDLNISNNFTSKQLSFSGKFPTSSFCTHFLYVWRQLCRPLHFSPVAAQSATEYLKLSQLSQSSPITFLHWRVVTIATTLSTIGFGQSLSATKPICKWRPPGPPLTRSLVTDPRRASAISGRRRLSLLL